MDWNNSVAGVIGAAVVWCVKKAWDFAISGVQTKQSAAESVRDDLFRMVEEAQEERDRQERRAARAERQRDYWKSQFLQVVAQTEGLDLGDFDLRDPANGD